MIYLGVSGFALLSFVYCSFWLYHYVDLEYYDTLPESTLHEDNTEKRLNSGSENGPLKFRAGIMR